MQRVCDPGAVSELEIPKWTALSRWSIVLVALLGPGLVQGRECEPSPDIKQAFTTHGPTELLHRERCQQGARVALALGLLVNRNPKSDPRCFRTVLA